MVTTSDVVLLQNRSILSNVNCDNLLLKSECMPILVGICRQQRLKPPDPNVNTQRITQYVSSSQKCSDIELYWAQATKLLSGTKPVLSKSFSSFEGAKPADRFWIIHNELTALNLESNQRTDEWKSLNIFNERSYLNILNSVIPIIVSCFNLSEVPVLMKSLVASTLAVEHISNLAVNLPSICATISEVLQNNLRDVLEPALLWRCSRVLLKIASKDISLAKCIRTSLVQKREHPVLCLEVTNRFIHDSDRFTDHHLCSRCPSDSSSGSSSTSSSTSSTAIFQ